MSDGHLAPVRKPFRALTRTVVPEASGLDDEGWRAVESVVEEALSSRPPALRRQLRFLVRLLQWAPVLRWGRPFTALPPERRRRVLETVQDLPVLRLRQGFWGLRSLIFMGYYGRSEVYPQVGYDARLRGRRQKDGPTRGRGAGEVLPETPTEETR